MTARDTGGECRFGRRTEVEVVMEGWWRDPGSGRALSERKDFQSEQGKDVMIYAPAHASARVLTHTHT